MDGLGGNPDTTFRELRLRLENDGHRVVLARVEGIRTHEDRVKIVQSSFENMCKFTSEGIFLVGFSAGGSAVRIASERIQNDSAYSKRLKGVALLSQAMPRGINYLTWPLVRTMFWRILHLIFGWDIDSTEAEYQRLIEPVGDDRRNEVVRNRTTIPGQEARTLAFWAPRFLGYSYPSLVIFGSQDRWVSTRAHRKIAALLRRVIALESYEVPDAGHLVLASSRRKEVIFAIKSWIAKQ